MESWSSSIIESLGYAGVMLLMFLENLFPPIPSEVVMPLAGYLASQGRMSLAGAILAGIAGSVLGALFWYWVARWLGEDRLKAVARRHGRWITLGPRDIDKADRWFTRYGAWLVFFGRVIPTVRTLIAIPAGLFCMPIGRYLVFTTLGTAIWTAALAMVGWWLGTNWSEITTYLDPITYAVIATALVIYVYRVVTFDSAESGTEEAPPPRR